MASIGDGSINTAYRFSIGGKHYFVKTNSAEWLAMFEAESAALNEIASTKTMRAPHPICSNVADGRSFLVLEWLDLRPLDDAAASHFGRLLAALHRHTEQQFGWCRNNAIGATLQVNAFAADWLMFWKERRLGFQLQLAARNGYTGQMQDFGARLLERCDVLFVDYRPTTFIASW
ncbi:MAG: fructosamine kinase family protein [Pseudomonadota bacterium]